MDSLPSETQQLAIRVAQEFVRVREEMAALGSASTFAELTDAASADLPAINGPLAAALSGKAPTSHTHTASQISDSTTTGRAVLTAATQSDARTTGLGSGATGDLLFQTLTPAAARETALNEILKYDPNAAAARTNPTFADDDVLAGINLTAGLWEISYYFAHDAGTCGVQARFRFGTPGSVDAVNGQNYGFVQRGNQALASLSYAAVTGTLTANAATTAITNWHHTGQLVMRLTGATTLAMQYQYGTSVAVQTITRLAGAFLRARKING